MLDLGPGVCRGVEYSGGEDDHRNQWRCQVREEEEGGGDCRCMAERRDGGTLNGFTKWLADGSQFK